MIYFEDIELNSEVTSKEYAVERDELVEFARKWDPQPYHTDEEAAKQWGLELSGSSTYSYAILTRLQTELEGDKPAIIAGLGIESWKTPSPLRPGHRVHSVSYVESKRESSSKPHLGIVVSVSKLVNQNGDVILEYKSSGLAMKKPDGQA